MTALALDPIPTPAPAVRDLDWLAPEQAAQVAEQVMALAPHFIPRHPAVPFYTLGAASYLDADKGQDHAYRARAAHTNSLLEKHFGALLQSFRLCVGAALGQECVYDPRLALPGFHVYLSDPTFAEKMGSVHIDLQFENIVWDELGYHDIDFARQLSLTAAIELPRSGGGLKVWPVNGQALRGASPEVRAEVLARRPKAELHRYRVGGMAMHSGFLFHQIAPIASVHPQDRRITLQAHALPIGARWLLYW